MTHKTRKNHLALIFSATEMRMILALAISLMTAVSVWAQYPDPFLTNENRPDGTKWLPMPPSPLSGEFGNDFFYYQWGKTQREGITGEKALLDESAELYQVFSEALGINLSPEATPEILLLAGAATTDAHAANKHAKNFYQRRRPFATFNEPSLKPEEDEVEALTLSYPSGHASRGWMYALVLSTVAPERTEALMERAREYALNRIICGHHWKSDIDASLMLIAGVFANIVTTEGYQQQLAKARAEYARILTDPLSEGIIIPKESQTYDTQEYQLMDAPSR